MSTSVLTKYRDGWTPAEFVEVPGVIKPAKAVSRRAAVVKAAVRVLAETDEVLAVKLLTVEREALSAAELPAAAGDSLSPEDARHLNVLVELEDPPSLDWTDVYNEDDL